MTSRLCNFDKTHVWHPYASLKDPPPVRLARAAKGVEIELADGRRLIDAVSSWWCVAHGHNHPAIVEAIRRQSEKMCHVMFGGFTHEPAVELAERLAAFAPPGLDRVFFADSGSISVEVAAKMAVQYQRAKGRPGRAKLAALKGGYHGDTSLAMTRRSSLQASSSERASSAGTEVSPATITAPTKLLRRISMPKVYHIAGGLCGNHRVQPHFWAGRFWTGRIPNDAEPYPILRSYDILAAAWQGPPAAKKGKT